MIPFDTSNPFPLLLPGSYTYQMAKEHAMQVDQWLGFQLADIERALENPKTSTHSFPQEMWIGLDVQSFLTPYLEIRTILHLLDLKPGQKVVDLGCGYARMAHVMGRHHPLNFFEGYEIVPQRVAEAQRVLKKFNYQQGRVFEWDLVAQPTPQAPIYFLYDYGSTRAIEKTLSEMQEISKMHSICVVGRGRASRLLIHDHHPWLSQVHEPRHFETFSIYRS